jgi:hypothetical protein
MKNIKKIGNYYHIDKDNVDIVPEKGSKIARYFVECFDRELVLILNDYNLEDKDIGEIEMQLDKNYMEWCDNDHFECCEEYMISKLSDYYRNSIVAVIYVGDDEDE